jgi:tetratricopeptide (TPR) repeat protein
MHILIFALLSLATTLSLASPLPGFESLRDRWAEVKYQMAEGEREQAFKSLAEEADRLIIQQADRPEPLIWGAILLASQAGETGGFGALSLVERARDLLLKAESIEPEALDGAIQTTLGSLYYQVPGWPLGFGDDEIARRYLERAIAIAPGSIDANYFYGDFMLDQGELEQGIKALNQALNAPARPGRELADQGRRDEIREALARARSMTSTRW